MELKRVQQGTIKEGERAPVDLNDLMSDLDSENATVINNEEEARELTQNLANTLAQLTLSSEETTPQTTAGTIIEKSISKLSLVTSIITNSGTTTVNDFLVISDTLETATANKDVLTLNARDESASLLNDIVEAVSERTDAPISFLERMTETVLKALPTYWTACRERSGNVSSTILQAINNMCMAVLKAKTPGDADTVINTTEIAARLRKTLVDSLNDSKIEHDLGMFKLPKEEMFPEKNLTGDNAVNLQMLAFEENPYKQCGDDNITSSVVALEVKSSNGSNFSDVAVAIEFLSHNETHSKWTIMVAHGKRPSVQDYLASWSFDGKGRKLLLLESSLLTEGTYYIQVQAKTTVHSSSEETISANVSYSLKTSRLKCLFWIEELEGWSLDGCRAGPETTSTEVQCLCNHLTSFAAQVFVEPNVIDFRKAMKGFVELSENPMVFTVVLSILGVYILLLIWARRRDIRNAKKAETVPLEENGPSDRYKYEILVLTGMRKGAGTTADVCFDLMELDGETGPRRLRDPNQVRFQRSGVDSFLLTTSQHLGDLTLLKIWHNNSGPSPSWYLKQVIVRDLKTDCVFVFVCNRWLAVEFDDSEVLRTLPLARQDDLKSFNHLFYNVTQKNITDSHLWFSVLMRPKMSNFTTAQRLSCCLALFYCTMLANAMFYQLDGESDSTITFNLGPLSISYRQVYIGIISSLIIFPVNIAIAGLFRNIGPKTQNEKTAKISHALNSKTKKRAQAYKGDFEDIVHWYRRQDQEEELQSEGPESISVGLPPVETVDMEQKTTQWLNRSITSCNSESFLAELDQNNWHESEIDFEVSEECNVTLQINEKKSESLKRRKRKLPHWCVYIAWFGVFAVSFVAAFFVTLYGFQFGREKASQWLASLLISLVQDIFISQPIKVLFLALFIALLIKKPQEQIETNNVDGDDMEDNEEDEGEHGIGNFEQGFPEYKFNLCIVDTKSILQRNWNRQILLNLVTPENRDNEKYECLKF
ncbi:hypothetical protein ACROYT_G018833 [Oculina patagonica]